MALVKKMTQNLSGESQIDGKTVVSMTATLSTDGNSDYVNQSVQAPELYAKNKKEIRKDIAEFQDFIYEQQDALAAVQGEEEAQAGDSTTTAEDASK